MWKMCTSSVLSLLHQWVFCAYHICTGSLVHESFRDCWSDVFTDIFTMAQA